MLQVLGIVCIVYLFALANGLFLVALERTFPRSEKRRRGSPAELPDVELAGSEALVGRRTVGRRAAQAPLLNRLRRNPSGD